MADQAPVSGGTLPKGAVAPAATASTHVSRKNLTDLTLSASGRAQFKLGTRASSKLSTRTAFRLFLSSSSSASNENADAEAIVESQIWTWGSGKYGRLGLDSTMDASVPTPVTEFMSRNATGVACGSFVTAFLMDDGEMWMSGKDIHGLFAGTQDTEQKKLKDDYLCPIQLTHFATCSLSQVAVGEKLCAAVNTFGELFWWGEPDGAVHSLATPGHLTAATRLRVVRVECGLEHAAALMTEGQVLTWGSNVQRQLGHSTAGAYVDTPTLVALLPAVGKITAIALGYNSTALLSAAGAIYACGAIVGQQDVQLIKGLSEAVTHVKCIYVNDAYAACVTLMGDAFLWHSGPVPFLDASSKEATQPIVQIFSDFSVRALLCGVDFIACLTDSGNVQSWGRCSTMLGIGEVRAKKHIVGPKLVGTFSARFVRSASCGTNHVGAIVVPASATRELLGWEMLETSRIYLRSLLIMLRVYRVQCKPRSKLAKLLAEVESMLKPQIELVQDLDRRMGSWTDATGFGPVFQRISSKAFLETYTRFQRVHSEWSKKATSQFAPGGKMFAEGELLLPEAMKFRKTDSACERKKAVHLIGLLGEPMERVREYFWLCCRLRAVTPDWHADQKELNACAERFQRELSGYYTEHEMVSMTIARLESDKEELLKKLAILSATNDNLFLSRNNHEMQKRDLTDVLEQHEHKIRTITRETDQLKERILELFLDKRRELLNRRRAESAAQRAIEEADVHRAEAKRLQVELDATRSTKLHRELKEQQRVSGERAVRILELERALATAQEAHVEQRVAAQHVSNLERENERLAKELTAVRAQLVQQIRRQHSPIEEIAKPAVPEGPFFDDKGVVRGATVQGLVNLLVTLEDKKFVQPYLQAFFLTYRTFITPIELAYSLQELYCKVPKTCDPPTQWSRVLGVLRYWITEHVDDFKNVPGLKPLTWSFLEETVCVTLSPSTADAIMKDFHKQITGDERVAKEQHEARLRLKPDMKAPLDVSVMSTTSANDVAQQLMLIEHELMRMIHPKEMLGCGWMKPDRDVRAPGISAVTLRFNQVSMWVVTEVLGRAELRDRRDVMVNFIAVAQRAKALGAFNTVLEVVAGLNHGSVQRLKRTWAEVPKKDRAIFDDLELFVSQSKSYHLLREAVQQQQAQQLPCVPYLGVYLADLVMTDEGSRAELSPGVVNFSKLLAMASIITEVVAMGKAELSAPVNTKLRHYLINCTPLPDDDAAWELSQDLEPKT